jgi:hypothetical protein
LVYSRFEYKVIKKKHNVEAVVTKASVFFFWPGIRTPSDIQCSFQ